MVLPPTLQRHELAKSIHATFLHPTARLPPLFDAVVVCRCSGGDYRWVQAQPEAVLLRQQHGSWERTRSAADARPNQLQKKEFYRLSSTCGAPRNDTNVQPVDARV